MPPGWGQPDVRAWNTPHHNAAPSWEGQEWYNAQRWSWWPDQWSSRWSNDTVGAVAGSGTRPHQRKQPRQNQRGSRNKPAARRVTNPYRCKGTIGGTVVWICIECAKFQTLGILFEICVQARPSVSAACLACRSYPGCETWIRFSPSALSYAFSALPSVPVSPTWIMVGTSAHTTRLGFDITIRMSDALGRVSKANKARACFYYKTELSA